MSAWIETVTSVEVILLAIRRTLMSAWIETGTAS